jgi:enoyl-CoA hydratase/carnithine racemase
MADLLFEKRGHTAWITLNRPERMNAISIPMLDALGAALVEVDRDADMRVIVVTGSGRGFCSGLDMKDAAAGRGIGGAGVTSPQGGAAHISSV